MGMATTSAITATTAATNTVFASNENCSTLGQEEAILILATICIAVIVGVAYTTYKRIKRKSSSLESMLVNLLFATSIAWVVIWIALFLLWLVLTALGF